MKEIHIDLSQFGLTCTGDSLCMDNNRMMAHSLIMTLKAKFATEYQDPFVYHTPSNWFEMLKQAIAPKWVLKRWPVKQDSHEISIKTVYPFLKTKIPRHLMGPFVTVLINDTNFNSFLSDTDGIDRIEWNKQVESILMKDNRGDGRECPCCKRLWFEKT